MAFEGAYAIRVESLRDLLEIYERELARRLRGHAGDRAIQAINGLGPIMASISVAEVGDVSRRSRAAPPGTTISDRAHARYGQWVWGYLADRLLEKSSSPPERGSIAGEPDFDERDHVPLRVDDRRLASCARDGLDRRAG